MTPAIPDPSDVTATQVAPAQAAPAQAAPAQAAPAQAAPAQASTAQASTAQASTAQASTAQASTAQASTAQAAAAAADTVTAVHDPQVPSRGQQAAAAAGASPVDPSAQSAATNDVARRVTSSLMRLRRRTPFFATLALYARFVPRDDIPTAATDGLQVLYNPTWLGALSNDHLDGVMLHEVLHAALGHVTRRGHRDPEQWNVAADIVVNGLVTGNGFEIPEGGLLDAALEGYAVEEVFAILVKETQRRRMPEGASDLVEGVLGEANAAEDGKSKSGEGTPGAGAPDSPGSDAARRKAIEDHWRKAVAEAAAVARGNEPGTLPLGVERHFEMTDRPRLDWRSVLWRFLTPTPTDFASFDRRFIGRGLYLETLEAEGLDVVVCIDTSGSIDSEMVAAFHGELDAILRAYPGLRCWLYYADAEAYGPFAVEAGQELPTPVGGGGTDFGPFFAAVAGLEAHEIDPARLVGVYLTDGYGSFPEETPDWPVLWAVTTGGLDDDMFPFGTVLRLGEDS